MLFNSLEYALFLSIVFVIYWLLNNGSVNWQNVFLLIASYIFYGWWNPIFLSLIFISSITDFLVGLALGKTESKNHRLYLLAVSLVINLGLLFYFKYFNFFIDSFATLLNSFGLQANKSSLQIILPVGISFYTFQTLSYTIDVYRKRFTPTTDFVAFFAYVAFFPQLVAGPIEKARDLLPQFFVKREFSYDKAKDGLRQILWGLFKKVVVADNSALVVNQVFDSHQSYDAFSLLIGSCLFVIQVYLDFSGYSDIAIGSARLIGFDLSKNFANPFFSKNINLLWQRWHITLMDWFREYVFQPLGGARKGRAIAARNVLLVFGISGLWHGASWNMLIWGLLNGFYSVFLFYVKLKWRLKNQLLKRIKDVMSTVVTFLLFGIATIWFRAETEEDAFQYFFGLFQNFEIIPKIASKHLITVFILLGFCFLIEYVQIKKEHGLEHLNKILPSLPRWLFYYLIIFLIAYYRTNVDSFVYFQF